ncbi:DUF6098 family protein [Streptomyces sp. WAC06614]|uniref:DUF6098 family protein n=1 Tax=Streptomyces sp. WAC06614 TaxID=2487416 RepID=UPI000F7B750B|nr:DUF6098 family protein [Streptomyces sp. WAC06614]RSS78507.1 hypothetical protein EF918_20630 [Streptomyces sp. WAC06614]
MSRSRPEQDVPEMATIRSLDELVGVLASTAGLYVRWSSGPGVDLPEPSSRDDLTGAPLPGLSANPLDTEPWWGTRSLRTWAARRLYDYAHLPHVKDRRVRPWLLRGTEVGRGPDNEPLVHEVEPLGWIDVGVIAEADAEVRRQEGRWGPLDRYGGRQTWPT